MKNNISKFAKLFVVTIVFFTLTGCTTIMKDKKGKPIKNPETGQTLTENILCQPENNEVRKIYEKNKVEINSLPKCDDMKIIEGGEYEGLWATIFVKPLSILIVKVGDLVKNIGLGVILTGLLIRAIMIPITKKTALQSENLKKAQPALDKLEKKYRGRETQEDMMEKSKEMMAIYKKYEINPMSGCIFAILQVPLFFAFYEAIQRIPAIFESSFLGFQLGTTPLVGIQQGHYYYIILIVLIIAATYFSFSLNAGAAGGADQQKQMKFMSKFMVVFIGIASVNLSSAIAFYWITSNAFTIGQNLLVKRRSKK